MATDRYSYKIYSQEGEDVILSRIFEGKKDGFYIDVGAHHPMRFSNTYNFYKRGWRGINIDARPGSMVAFDRFRRRDINIECPIGESSRELLYYQFNEPALNGFSKELSTSRDGISNYKIITTKKMVSKRLDEILVQHIMPNTEIDFMSVDVEGMDLEVLKSNNWNSFMPKIILVEVLGADFENIRFTDTGMFLAEKSYKPFAKTDNTVFFRKINV